MVEAHWLEFKPDNQEVAGLIPTWCEGLFLLLSFPFFLHFNVECPTMDSFLRQNRLD